MVENISKEDVFEKLFNAYNYGNLGLFIGAGFSKAVTKNALGWLELVEKVAANLKLDFPEKKELIGISVPEIASNLCNQYAIKENLDYKKAENKFKEEISLIVNWLPNSDKTDIFKMLFGKINPSWVVTTNYDLVIESILTGKSKSLGPSSYLSAPKGIIPIYHLHGVRTDINSIVIFQEDYVPLFRPSEYKQSKLATTIRESTTLVLGYGLGDVNVLSAVDWSKNVYVEKNDYPHEIIQALWRINPVELPYYNEKGNLIIEISNIEEFLREFVEYLTKKEEEFETNLLTLKSIIKDLDKKEEEKITEFIENQEYRLQLLKLLKQFEYQMMSSYVDFLSVCINKVWQKAIQPQQFSSYNDYINILLDILIHYEYEKMPPRLFQITVEALDKVMSRVSKDPKNKTIGISYDATDTWYKRRDSIDSMTMRELKNYAKQVDLHNLEEHLQMHVSI